MQHKHGNAPIQIRSDRTKTTDVSSFPELNVRDEQWRYLAPDRLGSLLGSLSPYTGSISGVQLASATKEDGFALPEDVITAKSWNQGSWHGLDLASDAKVTVADLHSSDRGVALNLIVRNQKHSKNTLILNHTGSTELAESVQIDVADESQLTVVTIANLADDAVLTSAHFARIGRNATLTHIVVSLTGKTIRVVPSVSFAGQGGSVEMLGAYFANGDQYIENRPFVDHNEPNCTSNVTYKGALQGAKAHTVWVGDVLIRQAAEGTKTYELNRNLLLTDGARADSVPNLEIETGQIEGAGHASASGRFDDEQLFYLQARGISELEAKRLVVKGFLNDVISQIDSEELVERLTNIIATHLEGDLK